MRGAMCFASVALFLVACLALGCAGQEGTSSEDSEAASTAAESEPESYPDPGPGQAGEVQAILTSWVTERVGEAGVYDIPPRGEHDVSGTMGDLHTVHQQDEDTYYVCVDFHSGEDTYDVDFFVDVTDEGLVVAEHYLHKVNGEVVE